MLGVILVLVGILMLLGVLGGGIAIGLPTLAGGLALYLGYLDVPSVVTRSLNIVIDRPGRPRHPADDVSPRGFGAGPTHSCSARS